MKQSLLTPLAITSVIIGLLISGCISVHHDTPPVSTTTTTVTPVAPATTTTTY